MKTLKISFSLVILFVNLVWGQDSSYTTYHFVETDSSIMTMFSDSVYAVERDTTEVGLAIAKKSFLKGKYIAWEYGYQIITHELSYYKMTPWICHYYDKRWNKLDYKKILFCFEIPKESQ